jgi:hypothetical protein
VSGCRESQSGCSPEIEADEDAPSDRFSVVGNYVHIVQVPCAIFQLATCARWYPDILDCSVLRPLLHRLLQQCDATINGAGGTAREISRARRTKIEVQELDRLAFDLCGDETPSSNKACPLGGSGSLGSAAGSMGNEEPAAGGLFGQEITASLASLRLELNLSVFALPSSQAL